MKHISSTHNIVESFDPSSSPLHHYRRDRRRAKTNVDHNVLVHLMLSTAMLRLSTAFIPTLCIILAISWLTLVTVVRAEEECMFSRIWVRTKHTDSLIRFSCFSSSTRSSHSATSVNHGTTNGARIRSTRPRIPTIYRNSNSVKGAA